MADSKISDLAAVTDLLDGDELVLARSGATKKIDGVDLKSEIALFDAYAYIRDEKSAGTHGGGFTSGAWQTRTLNTEVADADGIVSISANQFTLQAGTYLVQARAPVYVVDAHRLRLRNTTDSSDAAVGSSSHAQSANGVGNHAFLTGRFTIAGAKAFELQHYCETTNVTHGFGVGRNIGIVEVFAEVEIWREA